MRHAVVATHLMTQARTAASAAAAERQDVDAPAEIPAPSGRRSGRLAALFHRARFHRGRTRALDLRAESPGGGA
jgi:hypothetical protein